MKSTFILLLAFLAVIPMLPAQQVSTDQDSEVLIVPAGDKFLRWHGHSGRTYFVQISSQAEPLAKWTWAPYIDLGTGVEISHEIGGNFTKAFFRLQYTDEVSPPGITLEDWDIDNDGLTNLEEIDDQLGGTDPLNAIPTVMGPATGTTVLQPTPRMAVLPSGETTRAVGSAAGPAMKSSIREIS